MVQTVHVELAGSRVCDGLLRHLGACGLTGRLVESNDRCELEVAYDVAPGERLRRDVRQVLSDWTGVRDGSLILAELGEGGFVLRPPGE